MNLLETNWYQVFYWMSIADNVKLIFGTLSIILGVYFVGAVVAALGAFEDSFSNWESGPKRVFYIFTSMLFLSLTLWTFTPSKKNMMLIVAGGSIGNFVSNDSSSRAIPAELTKYVRNYLKKESEDLNYETKEDLGIETPKENLLNKVKDLTKEQMIEYLQTDTTFKIEK
jgi:hypothetical protein